MIPFLPDSLFTIAYAVALAGAAIIASGGGVVGRIGAAVMILNWFATRAVTTLDLSPMVMAWADCLSGIALAGAAVAVRRYMALLPLAAIFGAMVLADASAQVSGWEREALWAVSDVGGYVQLIILVGVGLAGGPGKRVRLRPSRHLRDSLVGAPVESRIQVPTYSGPSSEGARHYSGVDQAARLKGTRYDAG